MFTASTAALSKVMLNYSYLDSLFGRPEGREGKVEMCLVPLATVLENMTGFK